LPSFSYTPQLVPTPGKDLFYFPILHFIKCILIVLRSFTLVFQTCINHTLIRLTVRHYLLFLYCPVPLFFNSLQCIVLYYLHIQRQCFNIFHPLACLFPSPVSL
jgi:hypothetical protein